MVNQRVERVPVLVFEVEAYVKLLTFINSINVEISGFGRLRRLPSGDFLCHDIFILEQEVSSGHTEIDSNALAVMMDQLMIEGDDFSDIKLWWHSHHSMHNVGWSGIDDNNMRGLAKSSYFFGIVGYHGGKIVIRLDIGEPIVATFDNVPYSIQYRDNQTQRWVQQEIAAKVNTSYGRNSRSYSRPSSVIRDTNTGPKPPSVPVPPKKVGEVKPEVEVEVKETVSGVTDDAAPQVNPPAEDTPSPNASTQTESTTPTLTVDTPDNQSGPNQESVAQPPTVVESPNSEVQEVAPTEAAPQDTETPVSSAAPAPDAPTVQGESDSGVAPPSPEASANGSSSEPALPPASDVTVTATELDIKLVYTLVNGTAVYDVPGVGEVIEGSLHVVTSKRFSSGNRNITFRMIRPEELELLPDWLKQTLNVGV